MSSSYHPLLAGPSYKTQLPLTTKDATSSASQKYSNTPASSKTPNSYSSTRPSSSSNTPNIASDMSTQLSQKKAMQRLMLAYLKIDPMNCIIDPQGSKGGLYLGNIDAAENIALLKQHSIGAVLTVAARTGVTYHKHQIHTHEVIKADDVETFELRVHFAKIIGFIEENLKKTNVLVHCFAGISRSATAVIAYLMQCRGLSLDQAVLFCKAKRKVTNPNPGFVRQLVRFESDLTRIEPKGKQREEQQQRVEAGSSYEKQQGYFKEKEPKNKQNKDMHYEESKQRADAFFREKSQNKSDLNNKSINDQKKDDQQRFNSSKYDMVDSKMTNKRPQSHNNLDNASKTFSSTITGTSAVQLAASSSRDKRKALDEEYLFYLKRTRNQDTQYNSHKSTFAEIENNNSSQKTHAKGRSASNKPSSENILKDKSHTYSESSRQSNQVRGYSATAGRTNEVSRQFSGNDANRTFADQTSQQNLSATSSRYFPTGYNNKSDYKSDLDRSYLARSSIFNDSNKSYSTVTDQKSSTQFYYVPYYSRTNLEDRNASSKYIKDQNAELSRNHHRISHNFIDRTQSSYSALPRGYTSLLSSPLLVQYQANLAGYQPSAQPQSKSSVLTKYNNNLQNSTGAFRYDQVYPSNQRIAGNHSAASQLRSSISQNFASPISTSFSSSSYRQTSSQFPYTHYQSNNRRIN